MARGKKKRRSPNGTGSIWLKPDNRYSASLTVPYHDPATGRTKRRRITTTKRTWELAHAWLLERQRETLDGASLSPEDPTLADYLTGWLKDVVEPSVAPKTYEKREYHVRVYLTPGLGRAKLKELSPRHIHDLYTRMARREPPLATSTRRDIHTTLKMSLKQAFRWGLISRNPADMVDTPRPSSSDEEDGEAGEIRALTDEQARILFAATQDSRWHNYYVAAIRTGLRPGELLGLRWGDLSLDADPGSLRVRRTLGIRQGGGTYTKRPKSDAGRRTLALHWEATDALLRQREMLSGEGLPTMPESLVFPNTLGRPMSRHNLRSRHLLPDLERAGLPKLTLHELRHTYASIALYEWELPSAVVQEVLGHSSMRMTIDLYGHLMKNAQEQAMRALAKTHRRPEGRAAG